MHIVRFYKINYYHKNNNNCVVMFRTMDDYVRNYRKLKAKLSGLLFGNKYSKLKTFRSQMQIKVIPKLIF